MSNRKVFDSSMTSPNQRKINGSSEMDDNIVNSFMSAFTTFCDVAPTNSQPSQKGGQKSTNSSDVSANNSQQQKGGQKITNVKPLKSQLETSWTPPLINKPVDAQPALKQSTQKTPVQQPPVQQPPVQNPRTPSPIKVENTNSSTSQKGKNESTNIDMPPVTFAQKVPSDDKDGSDKGTKKEPEVMTVAIYDLDVLMVNLKVLSDVKRYDKLMILPDDKLNIDKRYCQSIVRAWSGDSRDADLTVLQKMIKSAEYYSKKLIKDVEADTNNFNARASLTSLTEHLGNGKLGIKKMIITYKDDKGFVAKLQLCLDDIVIRHYKNNDMFTVNQTNVNKYSDNNNDKNNDKKVILPMSILMANLLLLGQVKEETKLMSDDSDRLNIDTRMFPALTRTFFGDGRDDLLSVLKKMNVATEYYSNSLIKKLRENPNDVDSKNQLLKLNEYLGNAKLGIRSLIITYCDDDGFSANLELCLDEITIRHYKNNCSI